MPVRQCLMWRPLENSSRDLDALSKTVAASVWRRPSRPAPMPHASVGGGSAGTTLFSTSSSCLQLISPSNALPEESLRAATTFRNTQFVAASIVAATSFLRYIDLSYPNTFIGSATTMDSDLPNDAATPEDTQMLELVLEAARRANWDALNGPEHLRAGRYLVAEPSEDLHANDDRRG